jgi:hypothetical protein
MFWQESQALRDEVAGERRRADEARGELKKLFFFQRELRRRDRAGDGGAIEREKREREREREERERREREKEREIYIYVFMCVYIRMYLFIYVSM